MANLFLPSIARGVEGAQAIFIDDLVLGPIFKEEANGLNRTNRDCTQQGAFFPVILEINIAARFQQQLHHWDIRTKGKINK